MSVDWIAKWRASRRLGTISVKALARYTKYLETSSALKQLEHRRPDSTRIYEHFYYKMLLPKTATETEQQDRNQTPKINKSFSDDLEECGLFMKPIKSGYNLFYSDTSSFFTNKEAAEFFNNPFARLFFLEPFASEASWSWIYTTDFLEKNGKMNKQDEDLRVQVTNAFSEFASIDVKDDLAPHGVHVFALESALLSDNFPLSVFNRYFSNREGRYSWEWIEIEKSPTKRKGASKTWFEEFQEPILKNEKTLRQIVEFDVNRVEFELAGRHIPEKQKWIDEKRIEYVNDVVDVLAMLGKMIIRSDARYFVSEKPVLDGTFVRPNRDPKEIAEIPFPFKSKMKPLDEDSE